MKTTLSQFSTTFEGIPHRATPFLPWAGVLFLLLCGSFAGARAQTVTWQSAIQAGGNAADVGTGIAVDDSGNKYVTGFFTGSATFGGVTLSSAGVREMFLAKYNAADVLQWVRQAGGSGTGRASGSGVAVGPAGTIHVTGTFGGTVSFDDGISWLTSIGAADLFVANYDSFGAALWVKQAGGAAISAYNIAVDNAGNSYLGGRFSGTASFGPAPATDDLHAQGLLDAFFVKYDSRGVLQWARQAHANYLAATHFVAVDGTGNFYAVGNFIGTLPFDDFTKPLISAGASLFLVRFDSLGNPIWARQTVGSVGEDGRGVALDSLGNVYVTAYFGGTTTFGNGLFVTSASVFNNYFVAKYDPAGSPLWATQGGGATDDEAYAIAVDAQGNSYVTGFLGGINQWASNGDKIFVAKYNTWGALQWTREAGGSPYNIGNAIAVDSLGDVHVTGYFTGVAPFGLLPALNASGNSGAPEIFVAKLGPCITCIPGEIRGRIFSDEDHDCLPNAGEFNLANWLVRLDPGPNYALTDAQGNYSFTVPEGSYTVAAVANASGNWTQTCPASPSTHAVVVAAGQVSEGKNFGFAGTRSPCADLWVDVTAIYQGPGTLHAFGPSTPCCGANFTYFISYGNTGTVAVNGAVIELDLPGGCTYVNTVSANPAAGSVTVTGSTLSWNLPNPILPNDFGSIAVLVHLICNSQAPCQANLSGGQPELVAHARISPGQGDCDHANNKSDHHVKPCCSYDPNDKEVFPKGCGPEGLILREQALTYVVQFQNLGAGPAYVVVVQDVLDEDLDLSTLEFLGSSHPNAIEIIGREMRWVFPGIMLPPASENEPASHGFVKYRVRPRADVPVGAVIANSAAIYFDANEPVVTITTINTVSENPQPVAAFNIVPRSGTASAVCDFLYTGNTVGAQFEWNFGPNAFPSTSTEMNPTGVIFTAPGTHLVRLDVRLGDCVAEPAVQAVTVGPPTIHCPGDIVTTTDPGQCSAIVTFTATAENDRPGVTITCSPPSGSTFPKGTTTVHCTATDATGNTASCSFTVTVNATENPGNLYPIAINVATLAGVTPGSLLPDIFNGAQPGNFGWLTWAGSPSVPTLVVSLTPPGDSFNYVNPANAADHVISVGDWVQGKPGVANSSSVRNALDVLKTIDINVPVWDQASGNGSNTLYRVAGFAKVRIINYQLPGQNRITARYLGPACP